MSNRAATGFFKLDVEDVFEAPGNTISAHGGDTISGIATGIGSALSGGGASNQNSIVDLWAQLADDDASGISNGDDFVWSDVDGADARFDSTGGGKKTTGGPDKTTGKNKGDTTTDSGDGTTTGDTGSTSTGDTSGSTTDTGGTTSGTGETNTGSTDPNTHVSGLDTPDGYNIELVFEGTWDNALKQIVINAAELLSDIITDDIPNHNGVDDVRIQLYLDDSSASLGRGGVFVSRPDSLLPSDGYVIFNTTGALAALDGGYFDELATHELLHALGFGTNWDVMGLVDDHQGDLRFNGTNATGVYNTLFSDIAAGDPLATDGVPLESEGGPGTIGKHWDEATFGNEIMTGSLSGNDLVSDLTVAALEDMGYGTVYDASAGFDLLV